ncbi:MAG: AbrB/MazE/SpoVT family DNA-binding domain-containing protein [Nitrososphaerota archaeon]|nr:AbrB/MazE/SpoVT family DNA-binding domain-containing protein [Nitrososphaerota archaeon]MDG7018227.1 AbrB/MazE/SpoVT family DNA-binding domain-containing protein [Nitrososphaerota archaeon]
MEKTEVQRRFTTTIPKAVREKLGLKEGTGLFWNVEDGRIVVYPASYSSLSGMFKGRSGYARERKERAERWFLERGSE